jgi:hypothetical protein
MTAYDKGEDGNQCNIISRQIVVGGGDGSIQASQGRWRPISVQGRGAQKAGLIKQQQQAPPDEWGDDLDGVMITENKAHWRQGDWEDNQIGLQRDAATTTTMMTKGADNHNKEDPSKGGKYAWRAKARRRDWHLLRRYVAWPPMLTTATRHSCSWGRQWLQPQLNCYRCWEWRQQQSSWNCCCCNNVLDNADNDELALELTGTRQQE